ncbi:hypothetical protein AX766_12565 [Flavobacterium covae]|uniref:helix-turn-helix domain-containing protein n=1 Tax=Flavobacterium TaxID=237 RepID=UPI0007C19FCF|nr:helix-turn-helix domain-containing protein [Flavobacterium covae]AND65154.1 hypothetical protein AX766_12565 [Flavobacterium covae]
MAKLSVKPSTKLQPYIDRYFYEDKEYCDDESLSFFLPGTGLDLFFHFGESVFMSKSELSYSYLVCPREILNKNVLKEQFIAVRFKSGMFRHFSNVSYLDVKNKIVWADDVWGNQFKEFQKRFLDTTEISKKIELIEDFLIDLLSSFKKEELVNWDCFNQKIYSDYKTIRIMDLVDYSNFSKRTFERNFKDHFGVTPKYFQKLVRLEKTIKSIHLSKRNLLDCLEFGYYDQSHFNKDFKEFIRMSPREYFKKNKFHYYFESLNNIK